MDKKNNDSVSNGTKKESFVIRAFEIAGALVLIVGGYIFWVNSNVFDFDILGMTFRMPLEGTEHYCRRKSNFVFIYDDQTYEDCLEETSTGSSQHQALVRHVRDTFVDDDKKTILTKDQSECVAKKIESRLTSDQVSKFIQGTPIGDQVDASVSMHIMGDIADCVE